MKNNYVGKNAKTQHPRRIDTRTEGGSDDERRHISLMYIRFISVTLLSLYIYFFYCSVTMINDAYFDNDDHNIM